MREISKGGKKKWEKGTKEKENMQDRRKKGRRGRNKAKRSQEKINKEGGRIAKMDRERRTEKIKKVNN